MMAYPGTKNSKWKRGYYKTPKGYLRYSSGVNRNKMVHRVVMEEMLNDPISYILPKTIPTGWTVHHIDYKKDNPAKGNLMLLDKILHDAISFSYYKYYQEHYMDNAAPDWVTTEFEEDNRECIL